MSTARPAAALQPDQKPVVDELGKGQVVNEGKESEVTPTTNSKSVVVVPASGPSSSAINNSATTEVTQLKCSLTLDKLPKRVRLALTRRKKVLLSQSTAPPPPNGVTELSDDAAAILCLFCDRSWPGRKQYQQHNDQEHLTANRGRRASVRASAINGFPGCSLCNVTDKLFASHSNDLDALFAHLVEKHADRYYACKVCNIRFRDADTLNRHNETQHGGKRAEQSKKKAPPSSMDGAVVVLNKISNDSDGSDRFERKVTRQSNNSQQLSSSSSSRNADNDPPSALSRMALAQGSKSSLRGAARAIKGRLAANSQKAAAEGRSSGGRGSGKLTRSTSVSSSGSNTFSSSLATTTNSASNTPPPSLLGSSGLGGGQGPNSLSGGGGGRPSTSNPAFNNVFDENFYETITVNVRRNLAKWMDGKIVATVVEQQQKEPPMTPIIASSSNNSRKDNDGGGYDMDDDGKTSPEVPILDHPPPAVRSTLFRTPPVETVDNEIHEATALSAATAFPTLLTAEQYGVEGQAGGKIKRMFTKNSWKWKWDFVKKYKYVNEGGKIVKKAKEQNLGQRDLSKLDMWTQLTMRTKHEGTKTNDDEVDDSSVLETSVRSSSSSSSSSAPIGESVREVKRRQVNQLDTILDSRLLPQISVEQNEQRLIKLEVEEEENEKEVENETDLISSIGLQPLVLVPKKKDSEDDLRRDSSERGDDFPLGLQLKRNPNGASNHLLGLTLSGEWARPRCYVCIGCGAKFETVKLLQDHKMTEHPNTQTTHYEMVGRELIEGDLYKHLYIPTRAISKGNGHQRTEEQRGEMEKPQRARRATTGGVLIAKIPDDALVPCTKCKKDCAGRFELYRHMLDCVGDYAWLMAKKRFKYRYYGNRSRRRKSNARSIFGCVRPKKAHAKKERMDRIKRRKMRSRRKPQKPSDAETIEKMLANLPEKRVSRTVTTPPSGKAGTTPSKAANQTPTPSTSTIVTPGGGAGGGSAVTVSSTSKKQLLLGHKPGSGGIKRNLRSTLEAVAESVNNKNATGKKGKASIAEKKEQQEQKSKAAAIVVPSVNEKNSESEKIKEKEEIDPEKDEELNATTTVVVKGSDKTSTTCTKNNDGNDDDGQKEEEVAGKRKTFMTRLASNTKGIIKRIGRKMKGKKKAGQLTTTNDGEVEAVAKESENPLEAVEPVAFLGEAVPKAVEMEPNTDQTTTVQSSTAQKEQEDSVVPVESASVANDKKNGEKLKDSSGKSVPIPVSIKITTSETDSGSPDEEQKETAPEKAQEEANKSSLPLPDLLSPQISPSLSVPSNPSNLSSPMVSPNMQKRRVRKLNDCIARLTDKLQEKLGKPFIADDQQPKEGKEGGNPVEEGVEVGGAIETELEESSVPLDVPLNLSLKKDDNVCGGGYNKRVELNSGNLLTVAPVQSLPGQPIVDESECVVDLSTKDRSKRGDLLLPLPLVSPRKESSMTIPLNPPQPPPSLLLDQQQQLRIQEEFFKLKMNFSSVMDPQLNAKGDQPLIVPQIPKLGNYEVIKIPTYLPQKPVKGSTKKGRSTASNAAAASAAAAATAKKNSTTSAIEKITEMVADIVRNKKRNAALKEQLAIGGGSCAENVVMRDYSIPVIPVVQPVVIAEPVIPVIVPSVEKVAIVDKEADKVELIKEPEVLVNLVNKEVKEPVKKKRNSRGKAAALKATESLPIPPKETPVIPPETEKEVTSSVDKEKDEIIEPVVTPSTIPEVTSPVESVKPVESTIERVIQEVSNIPTVDEIPFHVIDKRELQMATTNTVAGKTAVAKKPSKPRAAPKGKKNKTPPVVVEPLISKQVEVVEDPAPKDAPKDLPRKTAAQEKKGRGKKKVVSVISVEDSPDEKKVEEEKVEKVQPSKAEEEFAEEVPIRGNNGRTAKGAVKQGKENKKVKIVELDVRKELVPEEAIAEPVPSEPVEMIPEAKIVEQSVESPVNVTAKVRKKRQSELAQILADQPVINNTERDISLTRRKSVSFPEATKRTDSPKLKPSPPKRKKDNATVVANVDEDRGNISKGKNVPKVVPVAIEKEEASEKIELDKSLTEVPLKSAPKSKLRGNKNKNKDMGQPPVAEIKPMEEEIVPNLPPELPSNSPDLVEDKKTVVDELPKNPTPKPKKKRRSELTQIIADQLLESFKEVDESQKDNLKILHDLSWADETMEIASRLKQSPTPRRQVTKKSLLVENPRRSPLATNKISTTTTTSQGEKTPSPLSTPQPALSAEDLKSTATITKEITKEEEKTATDISTTTMTDHRPKELHIPASPTTLESEKQLQALPLLSPSSTTSSSLFNTPTVVNLAAATTISNSKSTQQQKGQQPQTPSEDMSLFWKQNVEKEVAGVTNLEKRLDWVSKASELNKSGNVSDESVTNKQISNYKPSSSSSSSLAAAAAAASSSSTFVLKPSRLQAIASPPLVESFDQLRNCDRSSNSSSFCSPVVSPIGESKKSLLNPMVFPTPVRNVNVTPITNAAVNLLQFRDAHREVDESDGDLEDNVSVHSSDSMESSMTSMTKSKAPRKRRKRSLLTKKKVRGQGAVKANKENGPGGVGGAGGGGEKYHCEICNKTFEKADRLAKHKITLTHISRLSEIEFLNSQNAKAEMEAVVTVEPKLALPVVEPMLVLPPKSPEPQIVAAGGVIPSSVASVPILVPNHYRSPLTPGIHSTNQSTTLHNAHWEPISSPEQPQQSYLASGMPTGGARTETSFGAAMSNMGANKRPNMSVSGLSQEEKLFYEVCNMLKGSDRVGTQSENNSLTPRSNEAVSTWYSKTSTAFAIRSPTSSTYRQRSPKYAFSKIDLNQFSDISSDSDNNTYPSRGRQLVNGAAAAQAMAPSFQSNNVIPTAAVVVNNKEMIGPVMMMSGNNSSCNQPPTTAAMGTITTTGGVIGSVGGGAAGVVSPLRRPGDVYSDSDMGDSFPSAPGASDNENYVRTILDRSNNNGHLGYAAADRSGEWPKTSHEGADYRRERDEAFNAVLEQQNSAAGKMVKTKAAMKGFDNFRVSIPTEGLDMHQALGTAGHNPHMDSKLASLADIALRSSTLPLIENAISAIGRGGEEGDEKQQKEDLENVELIETEKAEDFASESLPESHNKTPQSKKPVKNGRKTQTRTDKNSIGNRLGFKAKKRKGAENTNLGTGNSSCGGSTEKIASEKQPVSGEGTSKNGLDVYDFDDSQGSTEAPILPMKKCGPKTPSKADEAMTEEVTSTPPKKTVNKSRPGNNKKGKGQVVKEKELVKVPEVEPESLLLEQSSQVSSDSFSDRDDFNYNGTPVPEDSDISSMESPVKVPLTPTPPPTSSSLPTLSPKAAAVQVPKKVPKKPLDNVQKKCLIMGRIFKNAQKNHKTPPESPTKAVNQPSLVNSRETTTTTAKKPPKVELDKLFDSLKEDPPHPPAPPPTESTKRGGKEGRKGNSEDSFDAVKSKPSSSTTATATKKGILKETENSETSSSKREEKGGGKGKTEETRSNKNNKTALVDDETALGGDNLAVGQRKSKRKCIQQVNFVETWSSDEYEEFQSTKDIFALIEANEKRSTAATLALGAANSTTTATTGGSTGGTKKKKVQSSTLEEPIKRVESKTKATGGGAGKIANRRKTIGFKETDDDLMKNRKGMISGRYSPVRGGPVKSVTFKDTPTTVKESRGGGGDGARQVGRQKRVSSEKLYYWSSSSSAEEDGGGGGGGKSGKASKGGANGKVKASGGGGGIIGAAHPEDEMEDEGAMEQHGWIVGGSHKKLVTLLAHAKGKKSEGTLKK